MITVNCNLCGRDDYRVRFPATAEPDALRVDAFRCTHAGYGHHPQIVECRHCGLVYTNPRWPTETVLDAYAAVEDETYIEERHGRELTFRHHLRQIERIIGPAEGRALLDVGCLLYTSDAADERSSVDLGGRRIIKKKKTRKKKKKEKNT